MSKLHILFGIQIFFVLVSMLTVMAINPYPAYDYVASVITFKTNFLDRYLFLLVFFYGLTKLEDCVWLLKWILGITILGNLITVMDALDMPDLGIVHQRDDGRVSGPMGESNQYGAFLVLFMPVTFYMILITKGVGRLFFIVGSIVSLGVLLLTASRGAVVGLGFSLFLVTSYMWRYLNKKYFLAASVAVVFLSIIVIFIIVLQTDGLLTERFVDQSGGYGSDARSISSGRSEIWSKALSKMASTPWTFVTGFGWSSWNASEDLARLYENVTKYNMAPHNSYLLYLFELGMIGLGLFLSALVVVQKYVFGSLEFASTASRGIMISFCYGFVALLVAIFFVDLFNPWLYVWSYVGIIMRVAYFSYVDTGCGVEELTTANVTGIETA